MPQTNRVYWSGLVPAHQRGNYANEGAYLADQLAFGRAGSEPDYEGRPDDLGVVAGDVQPPVGPPRSSCGTIASAYTFG